MNSIDIFPWNDNFNTGIALIDEQHKKLADLINLLASHVAFNANIPALNVIFDELAEYAVYHFDTEEKIWHEYMPEDLSLSDHLKVHSSFITEVLRLKSEENTKPIGKVIEEILAFLTRWLASHILENDRAMAMTVTAMQSGMSLETAKKHASEQMRGSTRVLIDIILTIYESLSTNTLHLMRELAEQKRMQMLLSDQERHLEVMLSTTPVGIFETDINGKCSYVNARWSEITGLSMEDAKGDGWTKALHSDDKDRIYAEWSASTAENRPFRLEYRFLNPNGKTIWVFGQSANYKSHLTGQSGYVGTITDITERKQAEELLRNKELQLSFVLEGSSLGFWDWDIPSGKVERNHIWAEMLGYTYQEIKSTTNQWADFVHPDDVEIAWESIHDALEGRTSGHELVYRMRTKSGEYKWILDRAKVVLRDSEGKAIRMTGSHTDYTERKQAEKRLFENEERLRLALISANQSWFDLDVATGEVLLSPEYAEMFGYDPATFHSNLQEWLDNIHPEDIDAVRKQIQACLRDGGPKSLDYRRRNSEGGWVWLNSIGSITEWDENHQPLRMIGIHTNITERKRLEFELTQQAHLDYLTGLSNRGHFMEQGEVELSRAIRYDTPLSLLMIDIDLFKNVNDTYGHQVGDIVLQALSKICQKTLRQVDVVGRLGGEEFAIILPEADANEALEVAERLRETIAKTAVTIPVGLPIHFTASIGVTTLSNKDVNIDTLLNQADKALYEAKETGRNKVCVYSLS